MIFSVDDYLKTVGPYLSHDLIVPDALANIRRIGTFIPGLAAPFFGFECRLGVPEAAVDFLLCASAKDAGRGILAGQDPENRLPDTFTHPVWMHLRAFCKDWAEPTSPLYETVKNVWLEFDLDRQPVAVPIPSIFFGAYPGKLSSENAAHAHWVTDKALTALLGRNLPTRLRSRILGCIAALPEGAYVFQIGMMLGRNTESVRICIRNLRLDHVPEYLEAIEWAGDIQELNPLLIRLRALVDRVDIDIDVGDKIPAKIGMECYINEFSSAKLKWRKFLRHLVDQGLCIPAKRKALIRYSGWITDRTHPEIWSDQLRQTSAFLESDKVSAILRWIHHIKVVYQPGQSTEAKAYLAVNHQWLNLKTEAAHDGLI